MCFLFKKEVHPLQVSVNREEEAGSTEMCTQGCMSSFRKGNQHTHTHTHTHTHEWRHRSRAGCSGAQLGLEEGWSEQLAAWACGDLPSACGAGHGNSSCDRSPSGPVELCGRCPPLSSAPPAPHLSPIITHRDSIFVKPRCPHFLSQKRGSRKSVALFSAGHRSCKDPCPAAPGQHPAGAVDTASWLLVRQPPPLTVTKGACPSRK